jgi:hypothetical protein
MNTSSSASTGIVFSSPAATGNLSKTTLSSVYLDSSYTLFSTPAIFNEKTDFKNDVVIKGKNLEDRLTAIEERIMLLSTDASLESDWRELKELGDQYRALEKKIKDKMKMFNELKK